MPVVRSLSCDTVKLVMARTIFRASDLLFESSWKVLILVEAYTVCLSLRTANPLFNMILVRFPPQYLLSLSNLKRGDSLTVPPLPRKMDMKLIRRRFQVMTQPFNKGNLSSCWSIEGCDFCHCKTQVNSEVLLVSHRKRTRKFKAMDLQRKRCIL